MTIKYLFVASNDVMRLNDAGYDIEVFADNEEEARNQASKNMDGYDFTLIKVG